MRGWIYDRAFSNLSKRWYTPMLERLPPGARLLDVGIGTGTSLCRNASLLRVRDLTVLGVDIDPDYLKRCRRNLDRAQLRDRVEVRELPVQQLDERGFDAAFFSASFMLMPDPDAVLAHVKSLLVPGGLVFFAQTFEERRSPLLEVAKPLLHKVTTIHFGRVTYEDDFLARVHEHDLDVVEQLRITGDPRRRTARLVVTAKRTEPVAVAQA